MDGEADGNNESKQHEKNKGRLVMITLAQSVLTVLNARKAKVLLIAEAALPQPQYLAFRKLFLNEFGQGGLEGELVRVITESDKEYRNGQE